MRWDPNANAYSDTYLYTYTYTYTNPYPNANFHSHGDADAKDWAHAEIASYSAAAAMRPPRQFAIAVDPFQYGAAVVPTLRFVDFS